MRALFLGLGLLLAGCTTGSHSAVVASIDHDGASYPIRALENGQWEVIVDGSPQACRTPTMEDCAWALRHRLDAQDALDALENGTS